MKKDLKNILNMVTIVKNGLETIGALESAIGAIRDLHLLDSIKGTKVYKKFYATSSDIVYDYVMTELRPIVNRYKSLIALRNDSEDVFTDNQFSLRLSYGTGRALLDDKKTMIYISHSQDEKATAGFKTRYIYIEWIGINADYYRTEFIKRINKRYLEEYDNLYIRTGVHVIISAVKRPEMIMVQPEYFEAVEILEKFINNKNIYDEVGAIYKESFLFHGEPGAGKTTAVMVLAAKYNAEVIKINLSSTDWKEMICAAKYNWRRGKLTFVLIEDIDLYLDIDRSKMDNTENEATTHKKNLLWELFQFMDGSESQPGIVYFLTTNYIKKLDKALIRPGRVNHKIPFHNIDTKLQDKMINNFKITREDLNDDTIPEICSPSALAVYLLNRRIGIIKPFEEYVTEYNNGGKENE